jgi:NAD(P)H dehydrogenase (quinone)
MKAHIVFAHPGVQSFNSKMRNTAVQTLEQFGWSVSISDLFQMKFKASADEYDFTELSNTGYFDLQSEQQVAAQKQTFAADIQREQQMLSDADLVIFQFPLWWYCMPEVLKGYIDRVFTMGWAYGGNQALAGKQVLVSMTTGAPDFAWTEDKRGTIKDIFKHLFIGTFGLCGMQSLEPFIVYGAKRISEQEKEVTLEKYRHMLQAILN